MTVYVDNLYQNIIKKNAEKYVCLKVITGYSSANFLNRVHNDFPNLKISLFIGMALDGISIQDHKGYCNITEKSDVNVYYHVMRPETHQKIIDFFDESNNHSTYVGSANFSDSGLENQNEIMVSVEDNLDDVFSFEQSNCLLCTDSRVAMTIPFSESDKRLSEHHYGKSEDDKNTKKLEFKFDEKIMTKNPDDYSDGILVSLIHNDKKWKVSGINAKNPYVSIVQLLACVVPINKKFILKIGKNKYHAKRCGRLDRNIELIDGNWADIVKKVLNIDFPVSPEYLDEIGCKRLILIPETSTKYNVKFVIEEE